jgi:hypothetical protein
VEYRSICEPIREINKRADFDDGATH